MSHFDFNPGDKVAVMYRDKVVSCPKIDRLTKSHVVIGSDKYSRFTGYRVGNGTWDMTRIEPWADKHSDELAANRIRARLATDTSWINVPLKELKEIAAILDNLDGGAYKSTYKRGYG